MSKACSLVLFLHYLQLNFAIRSILSNQFSKIKTTVEIELQAISENFKSESLVIDFRYTMPEQLFKMLKCKRGINLRNLPYDKQ